MLGGYKLIDFGGVDISTSKTISGIYEKIEKTEKRIVVCNVKLGTTIFKEMVVDVFKKVNDYRLYLTNSIIKIIIGNSSSVGDNVLGLLYGLENYKISYNKDSNGIDLDANVTIEENLNVIGKGTFGDTLRVNADLYAEVGSIGGLTCESEDDGNGVFVTSGRFIINHLPTTDPQEEDKVWNDNGTLKISSGE